MPEIIVTLRDGETSSITVDAGITLMEALRGGNVEELQALCGGCCSCATCHVYIDAEQLPLLPPMSSDEDGLLDSSSFRQDNSRLSCQITLTGEIAVIKTTIAPED